MKFTLIAVVVACFAVFAGCTDRSGNPLWPGGFRITPIQPEPVVTVPVQTVAVQPQVVYQNQQPVTYAVPSYQLAK